MSSCCMSGVRAYTHAMPLAAFARRSLPSPVSTALSIALESMQEAPVILSWVQAFPEKQAVHVSLPCAIVSPQGRSLRRRLLGMGCTVSTRLHV